MNGFRKNKGIVLELTSLLDVISSVFEDVSNWGVSSLHGWVNSYESVHFVAINDHTAVITGE